MTSGVALADEIVAEPGLLAGQPTFELGSGIGITAAMALRAGAVLTVADYAPEALALCRLNALLNAGREPATIRCNWREPGRGAAGATCRSLSCWLPMSSTSRAMSSRCWSC